MRSVNSSSAFVEIVMAIFFVVLCSYFFGDEPKKRESLFSNNSRYSSPNNFILQE